MSITYDEIGTPQWITAREQHAREDSVCCCCDEPGEYYAAEDLPGGVINKGEWYCADHLEDSLLELMDYIRNDMRHNAEQWWDDYNDYPEYTADGKK